MNLQNPPNQYNAGSERQRNLTLQLSDAQNHKKNRDVEVGDARLILKSPNGNRWSITVDNAGAITATAL